ncbi:unknown [Firmicutes bacterium CAG:631]|nr:unknown [Firmicutes bacterium CAG:631]
MNLDRELRDLKKSYDDTRWKIKSIIEKGNSQIKDLERFYSSNVGKVEESINQTLVNIEKEVNNLISNFEKNLREYKTSQNEMLKEMEETYLKEIDAKKKSLETEFKSKIKCQFVVKGVL